MERDDDSFGSDSDLNDSLLRRLTAGESSLRDRDEPAAPLLAPGTETPAFRVEEIIGEGGFGTVYRALTPDKKRAALKVSKKALRRLSPAELAYQQNEIEVLMGLEHPSLVQLFDHGVLESGHLYFLMELIDGVRLDDYARGRRLDALEAIRIAQKIAEVLAYCHDVGILHLDLKPSNIILVDTFTPRLKMLDFGLAQLSEAALASGAALGAGTLLYLAPEAISRERGPAGPRTDLYSLGAILYTLLAGRPPFADRSFAEIYQAKLNEDPPPLAAINPDVPRSLSALVSSLLSRDARERHSSAALLSSHLKKLYFASLHGEAQELGAIESGDIPFVGRNEQLSAIESAFFEVRATKRGRTILIEGSAGMGKTRLLAEALTLLRRDGDELVGYGRCRRLGSLVPFGPLREALARAVQATFQLPKVAREAIKRRIEAMAIAERELLARQLPEVLDAVIPHQERSDPPAAQELDGAIVALLSALGAEAPIVLVIEDVHWMDAATIDVLAKLLSRIDDLPVLLLLSGRPGHELREVEIMPLSPLDPRANDELLAALAGPSTIEAIEELKRSNPLVTGGNPMFVKQIVSDFRVAESRPGSACIPPRPLYSTLDRSISRLRPDFRRVLGIGAIIGRRFRISDIILSELADDLTVAAAIAEADHLYICRCGDDCSFLDEAIREQLELSIDPDERADIHRRLAERLEKDRLALESRAHHLYSAGEHTAAAEAYFAAAQHAGGDPRLAADQLQRAVKIALQLSAGAKRSALLIPAMSELAKVAWPFGQVGELLELLDRCVVGVDHENREQRAMIDATYARLRCAQGDFLSATDHASRCRDSVKTDVIGRALFYTGRFAGAAKILAEGCDRAKVAGELVELCESSGLLGAALGFVGRFDEARVHVRATLELARSLEDPMRAAAARCGLALLCEAQGRWIEGAQAAAELLAAAEQQSAGGIYVYLGTMLAGRHQFHLGNLVRAKVLLRDAIELSGALATTQALSWAHAYSGDIHLAAGELEDAALAYRRALDLACAGTGDAYAGSLSRIGLAHVEALTGGDPARAKAWADAAISQAEASGNRATLPVLMTRRAEILDAFGDREAAARVRADREIVGGALALTDVGFWPGAGSGNGEDAQRR